MKHNPVIWTPEQIAFLREHYPLHGKKWCVEKLGMKEHQVRYKASNLGLRATGISEAWKQKQAAHAERLKGRKRPAQALVMEALRAAGKLERSRQSIGAGALKLKEWYTHNPHPKGATGIKFTQATKDLLSAKSRARWDRMTPEQRVAHTTAQIKARRTSGKPMSAPRGSWRAAWRVVGMTRSFFRSRWEANYARYLELLRANGEIASWQHEPHAFVFPKPQPGCFSYLPDFKVTTVAGAVEWHEVKGWMDARSRLTLDMMAAQFPQETLVVVRDKRYRAIQRSHAALIEGWEPDGREACIVVTITPLVKAVVQEVLL